MKKLFLILLMSSMLGSNTAKSWGNNTKKPAFNDQQELRVLLEKGEPSMTKEEQFNKLTKIDKLFYRCGKYLDRLKQKYNS